MLTGPPIPEIQHFQNLTLKIQGQGHTWRPYSRYNTLSTHITFVRCRWALAFLSIAIKKFDLGNPRSRSWLRWTLKLTTWVQHSIDSHPFHSKSISHPIPEIQHFQIWPWKSKVKVMGEANAKSHNMGPTLSRLTSLSFHVNLPSHSLDTTFFKIGPWKSRVKVTVEVEDASYKVGVTFYRLISLSFHVNRSSHSWDTTFSKFDLENPRSRSWVRWMLKVTTWVQHSIDSHPFRSMSISHPFPEVQLCQNLTLKILHIPFIPCQSALPIFR